MMLQSISLIAWLNEAALLNNEQHYGVEENIWPCPTQTLTGTYAEAGYIEFYLSIFTRVYYG